MYHKKGLFRTKFQLRHKSKDQSKSYVHILMLVRPISLGMSKKSSQKIY
jgi:hypothetical protein